MRMSRPWAKKEKKRKNAPVIAAAVYRGVEVESNCGNATQSLSSTTHTTHRSIGTERHKLTPYGSIS